MIKRLWNWIRWAYKCNYVYINCGHCNGTGRDEYGGKCIGPYWFIGCNGTGKKLVCPTCEARRAEWLKAR